MKKFYEVPVVEIAVFDVEDIITTSTGGDTYQEGATATQLLNAIQNEDSSATSRNFAGAGLYDSYKW